VNAVATVLKAFFADLTDPLVPMSLYDELIEASGNYGFLRIIYRVLLEYSKFRS
jgi:hypothetical protein